MDRTKGVSLVKGPVGIIGVVLVAEGFGHHVPKGYIYFAMAFSLGVEMMNIKMRRKADSTVKLRQQIPGGDD